jgi:basic membrane protein A
MLQSLLVKKLGISPILAVFALIVLGSTVTLAAGCYSRGGPYDEPTIVYVLYPAPKGDRSYSDSAYAGLFRAQEEYGFLKEEYTIDDIVELDKTFSSESFDEKMKPSLTIIVGYNYEEYSTKWAKLNSDIDFLLIDHRQPSFSNVRTVELTTLGCSYLAGILAAQVTVTNKVGIILGARTWVLEDFHTGFAKGAKSYNHDIGLEARYLSDDASGFSNPGEGRRIANEMYESGYDIIYAVAGASGLGVVEAAKGYDDKYVIGVDSDQTYLGPNVIIASVVKNLDTLVYQTIVDYVQGIFEPGVFKMGLNEGMTALVFNPKFGDFEREVMKFYDQAKKEEQREISTLIQS